MREGENGEIAKVYICMLRCKDDMSFALLSKMDILLINRQRGFSKKKGASTKRETLIRKLEGSLSE